MAGNGIAKLLIARLSVVSMAPCFAALSNRGGTAVKQGSHVANVQAYHQKWSVDHRDDCTGTRTGVGGAEEKKVSQQPLQPCNCRRVTRVLAYTVLVYPSLHEAKWKDIPALTPPGRCSGDGDRTR